MPWESRCQVPPVEAGSTLVVEGLGERERGLLRDSEHDLGLETQRWWVHSPMNGLNVTELHTLRWFLLPYVNFISAKQIFLEGRKFGPTTGRSPGTDPRPRASFTLLVCAGVRPWKLGAGWRVSRAEMGQVGAGARAGCPTKCNHEAVS